jgi:hypothetical protein
MKDGRHPVTFVFDCLREAGCSAIPIAGISRDSEFTRAIKRVISKDGRGIGLRLKIEEAARSKIKDEIDAFFSIVGLTPETCDLILGLGAPNFEPVEGFTKMMAVLLRRFPYLPSWRTLTLIGTSFPSTMAEIKQSVEVVIRWEWILYKRLIKALVIESIRLPTFGDYAINHPAPVSMDMRLVKPSATIRYAVDDGWLIVKGSNVRDNGYDQFRIHCRTILKKSDYLGSGFSQGDKYISLCAAGSVGTGNLTTWRKVGTNHHIEKVVQDVAKLYGSSAAP